MAEENQNGKNGNRVSLLQKVKAAMKEDVKSLKTDLPAKAKEQIEGFKDPTKTQVYTSIFRHKHDDTPRNRALGVLSNVFLHLHPAKINRDAVRYSYTWGMGGITFYLFIVLTLTGVLLMFYYHPSKVQAFRDVLYLEHDVPLDRKSTRLNSSHGYISYAVFCLKKKKKKCIRYNYTRLKDRGDLFVCFKTHKIAVCGLCRASCLSFF